MSLEDEKRKKVAEERAKEQDRLNKLAVQAALKPSFLEHAFRRIDAPDKEEEVKAGGGIGSKNPELPDEGEYSIIKDGEEVAHSFISYRNGALTVIHKLSPGGACEFTEADADALIAFGAKAGIHHHVIGFGNTKAQSSQLINWSERGHGAAKLSLKRLEMVIDAAEKKGVSIDFDQDAKSLLQYFGKDTVKKFEDRKTKLSQNQHKNKALAELHRDASLGKLKTDLASSKPADLAAALAGKTQEEQVDIIEKRLEALESRNTKIGDAVKEMEDHVAGAEKTLKLMTDSLLAFRNADTSDKPKAPTQEEVDEFSEKVENIRSRVEKNFKAGGVYHGLQEAAKQASTEIAADVGVCKAELAKIKGAAPTDPVLKRRVDDAVAKVTKMEDDGKKSTKALTDVSDKADKIEQKAKDAVDAIDQQKAKIPIRPR